MNLRCIAGHTVDMYMRPKGALVLDVGCRDFAFCRGVLEYRNYADIIAYDPDPSVSDPKIDRVEFAAKAVTGDPERGECWFIPEGEAGHVCRYGESANGGVKVPTIPFWLAGWAVACDLVKLDCEGSEFGILENWRGPGATQISVEFHDYMDRARWNDAYFAELFAGPLKDYRVVQHELTPVGPGNTLSHWDSLLVLKGAK